MENKISELKKALSALSPEEGLRYISGGWSSRVVFSSSLGIEDQAITHMIASETLNIEIFTIDTGRLFQETYDLLDFTRKKYNIAINVFFPNHLSVESLVRTKGPNSFFESVGNRKECCSIRKIEPLKRALSGASVWITGIRSGQSDNRKQMELIEWDPVYNLLKYNPLMHWTKEQLQSYIDTRHVPINDLHRKGYPSIGCAPCTRSILSGEDDRAGRWWWETSNKECGLHERESSRQE